MDDIDYTDFELFIITQIYIGFLIGVVACPGDNIVVLMVGTIIYLVGILYILFLSLYTGHKNKK